MLSPIELSLFTSRINAVCEEMGAVLRRSALSPNIKDRLDFSCAIFDATGGLCAQAAHIPVHLGSMAYAMADIVSTIHWCDGDMIVLNDPYLGGTHLPDVTVIAPVFRQKIVCGFVVNRAHHADIGASAPGSMPLSRTLAEEGLLLPPQYLVRGGNVVEECMVAIAAATGDPIKTRADFSAQLSANRAGLSRLGILIDELGVSGFASALEQLNAYGERLARTALADLPNGVYSYVDYLDDDGVGGVDLAIQLALTIQNGDVLLDFTGTTGQVAGNLNCPLSVAAAAAYYVFRCLMPPQTPACAGTFRALSLRAPQPCLINAQRPAAVAAGNVETSSRVVDVVLGALAQAIPERIPAASQGSMNNIAMGARASSGNWDYYETIGGGMGAGAHGGGLSAVQTHMTNTLNTPIESLESQFPLRVCRYQIRRGSGGAGKRAGGDGLIREFEFLAPASVTLLTERRRHSPWGSAGGQAGAVGENRLNEQPLPGKIALDIKAGDRITIMTPGGGGWGGADEAIHE